MWNPKIKNHSSKATYTKMFHGIRANCDNGKRNVSGVAVSIFCRDEGGFRMAEIFLDCRMTRQQKQDEKAKRDGKTDQFQQDLHHFLTTSKLGWFVCTAGQNTYVSCYST